MSEEFSELRGLHGLGNPQTEDRSADRGPTGESPIGSRIWGGIVARGTGESSQWKGRGGMNAGKEILRKASSR